LIDFYIDTSSGGVSPLIFVYCFYPWMQAARVSFLLPAAALSAASHMADSLTPTGSRRLIPFGCRADNVTESAVIVADTALIFLMDLKSQIHDSYKFYQVFFDTGQVKAYFCPNIQLL